MTDEKRLIDAKALIADIQGTVSEICMKSPYDAEWFTRLHDRQREIIATIERQPKVDAVLVVRCKDCKHFNPLPGYQYIDGFCGIGDIVTRGKRADGYCDMGERKDNDA